MKNAKRPSLKQKKILDKNELVPMNWLIVKESKEFIEIISRKQLEAGKHKTRKIPI